MAKRKKRSPFPAKLAVLPDLPSTGFLSVRGKSGDGWLVHYDVKTPEGTYVYDRRVLTAEQIKRWTGVDPGAL